ncbi:MAG: hypothetical protein AAF587_35085 [Bacteroidota bacterium]
MTEQDFKDKIDQAYKEANEVKEPSSEYQIQRGRSHTISSYAEDLFALYIAEMLENSELNFWVDLAFRVKLDSWKKAKAFNPDLGIIHKGELTHYFDIKMNLGFQRNLTQYLVNKNQFVEKIRGQNGYYLNNKKEECQIQFSPEIVYQLVILFGWNVSRKQMAQNLKLAGELPFVEAYVLFQVPQGMKHPEVSVEEFARLHQKSKDLFPA